MIGIAQFFSVVDNNGWYSNQFCLSRQELSVYHTLSWTILGDIFHGCVCRGQYRLVYQPVLSVMDKIGWNINFYLSWTIIVGISPSFVCHGKHWLVYRRVLSVMDNIIWYTSLFCLP